MTTEPDDATDDDTTPVDDTPDRTPAQLSVRDAALGLTRDDLPIVDGVRPPVGDALL